MQVMVTCYFSTWDDNESTKEVGGTKSVYICKYKELHCGHFLNFIIMQSLRVGLFDCIGMVLAVFIESEFCIQVLLARPYITGG